MGEAAAKERQLQEAIAAGVPKELRLTPTQGIALTLLQAQIAQLQIAANQCAFYGEREAADIVVSAREHLEKAVVRLQHKLSNAVQLATPADVPRLVAP